MRAIGYTRVSTEGQEESGLGLAAQRETLLREIAGRGWKLHSWTQDVASASAKRRDGLSSAMDLLDGQEADVLMVARLDRLVRSVFDLAVVMERAKKGGWQVVILAPAVDTTDAFGRAMMGMAAVFAQLERDLISQRTSEALRAKIASGEWNPSEQNRCITPEALDRIVELWESGMRATSIAARMEAEGWPPPRGAWNRMTVTRHLKRLDLWKPYVA